VVVVVQASNVGDSPILVIQTSTGHVSVLSGRHSWDNPVERQKYLDRYIGVMMVMMMMMMTVVVVVELGWW
jgi:hypothetical protein